MNISVRATNFEHNTPRDRNIPQVIFISEKENHGVEPLFFFSIKKWKLSCHNIILRVAILKILRSYLYLNFVALTAINTRSNDIIAINKKITSQNIYIIFVYLGIRNFIY